MRVTGGIINADAVSAGGGDGLAISLSEDPSSLVVWTAWIDVRTDEGRFRVGRIQTRPPGVTAGNGSRLVAMASYPGAVEWYVTITALPDDGTGRVPVAELALSTTATAGAIPPGVTVVDTGRSESWTPLDFGDRLDAWWTARKGVISVFGAPGLWKDQSGEANHLSSLNGDAQPILVANPPGVQFDGTAWMTVASSSQLAYTRLEAFTWWFVGTVTAATCGILFRGVISGQNMRFLSGVSPNLGEIRFRATVVGDELAVQWPMPRSTPLVIVIEYDGSSSAGGFTVTQNGVQQTLNVVTDNLRNSTTTSDNKFGIGAFNVDSTDAGQSAPYTGIAREFGFVSGAIDASERLLLTARRAEWGF